MDVYFFVPRDGVPFGGYDNFRLNVRSTGLHIPTGLDDIAAIRHVFNCLPASTDLFTSFFLAAPKADYWREECGGCHDHCHQIGKVRKRLLIKPKKGRNGGYPV